MNCYFVVVKQKCFCSKLYLSFECSTLSFYKWMRVCASFLKSEQIICRIDNLYRCRILTIPWMFRRLSSPHMDRFYVSSSTHENWHWLCIHLWNTKTSRFSTAHSAYLLHRWQRFAVWKKCNQDKTAEGRRNGVPNQLKFLKFLSLRWTLFLHEKFQLLTQKMKEFIYTLR